MANYGFATNKMISMDNAYANRAGVITTQSLTSIPNGAFVVADNASALPLNIYGTTNIELENFKRFATNDTGAAYILDASLIPEVTDINGNTYKAGAIVTNMSFIPSQGLKYRQLFLEDRFYLFDGNISGTVSASNKYLVPDNGSFLLAAASSIPQTGFCVQIMGELPLNNGLNNVGSQYLCKVIQL